MDCLIEVATRGDRDSMMKVARAFDTGVNLGSARYDLVASCFCQVQKEVTGMKLDIPKVPGCH